MMRIVLFLLLALNAYAEYPQWLKYGIKVISEFKSPKGTQKYVEGYGLIINDGLILTSSRNVYRDKKAEEITLYHTEMLGEPIACLSHARILAVDDNLDLAVLEAERFTDIYCNILPEPNLREENFAKVYFNLLFAPLDLPLDERLEISYFKEQDWSQFSRQRIALKDFLKISDKEREAMLGMPLFVEDEFLGLDVRKTSGSKNKGLQIGILTHSEILEFLCKLESETSVFKNRRELDSFCPKFLE